MIPFRTDCYFCRGHLRHTEPEHDRASRDFEGVLMRVGGDWHARPLEARDRELAMLTPDVRLAATEGLERPRRRRMT